MLFHKEGTVKTAERSIRFHKLDNSHGPDIDFGVIFLPGKEVGHGLQEAATLLAEWVGVAKDSCTVALTEVCKERRRKPSSNYKIVEMKKE